MTGVNEGIIVIPDLKLTEEDLPLLAKLESSWLIGLILRAEELPLQWRPKTLLWVQPLLPSQETE